MPHVSHPDDALTAAMALLRRAGAQFFCILPGQEDSVSLTEASRRLDVSADWLRDHLAEFPNAWRLPAGARTLHGEGRNVGELRIPVADILALRERQRLKRLEVPA